MSARLKVVEATGWVIERHRFEDPVYWSGDQAQPWVNSASNAIQFADKVSAEKIISRYCDCIGRAVIKP